MKKTREDRLILNSVMVTKYMNQQRAETRKSLLRMDALTGQGWMARWKHPQTDRPNKLE